MKNSRQKVEMSSSSSVAAESVCEKCAAGAAGLPGNTFVDNHSQTDVSKPSAGDFCTVTISRASPALISKASKLFVCGQTQTLAVETALSLVLMSVRTHTG